MNRKQLLHVMVSLMLLITAPSVMATMYKWVDDEGNIHYSQTPPVDREASTIAKPRTPPPPPPSTEGEPDATASEGGEELQGDGPTEEEIRAEKERIAQECQRARQWISEIENKPRLRVRDDDGNLRYLSEEERQARLKQAQDYLKKYCN